MNDRGWRLLVVETPREASDFIRCEPYRAVMSAASCIARQRKARATTRDMSAESIVFGATRLASSKCVRCAAGERHAAALGVVLTAKE